VVKNAFSVDVEDYYHVAAFRHVVGRSSWEQHASRVVANTERLLEILASHDVTATFFVLGWVAEKHPGLARMIDAAGHEVACHGYSHQNIFEQERKVFASETRLAKAILEQEIGKRVDGYRAASFSINSSLL
jgi:polysaccharide deacetylase family protein (PEP-CTERM system associated)